MYPRPVLVWVPGQVWVVVAQGLQGQAVAQEQERVVAVLVQERAGEVVLVWEQEQVQVQVQVVEVVLGQEAPVLVVQEQQA